MPQPVVNENEAGVDYVDDEKVKKIENGLKKRMGRREDLTQQRNQEKEGRKLKMF